MAEAHLVQLEIIEFRALEFDFKKSVVQLYFL